MTVLRGEKLVVLNDLKASLKVSDDRYGLGIGLIPDEQHTLLADVDAGSSAAKAGLKGGDTLTAINGKPVTSWFQVQQILSQIPLDKDGNPPAAAITYLRDGEKPQTASLQLDKAEFQNLKNMRYTHSLQLRELTEPRIARGWDSQGNPATGPGGRFRALQAAYWGVTETRDFVLQFYLTLHRMVDRSISPSNMMGPVGIFIGGKAFAYKGTDWLLWFLSMISANLAVVNFLPIPVVDGGQFMFLIFEKIKGKPLSPRAMAIAQYVGLAFLAGVVLFVTYHDIIRIGHYG
jgi:regulator of sigma E protease